jgi:hypothetical protein
MCLLRGCFAGEYVLASVLQLRGVQVDSNVEAGAVSNGSPFFVGAAWVVCWRFRAWLFIYFGGAAAWVVLLAKTWY